MKKTLALLLALAMVFSTVTVAFAEEAIGAEAQACVELKMLQGEGAGVNAAYLAGNPTRLNVAIMILRFKGLEDEALAYTGTENFADVDQIKWAGGKAIAGYLKTHPELGFQGDNGNLKPGDAMNAQAYYKVMLETLGYKQDVDFAYADTFTFAATKGLSKVAAVTNFTVNDVAIATIEALKATVKDGEVTLAEKLVADKVLDAAAAEKAGVYTPVPEVLAVESVKAINLKETVVTFNKEVDKDTAIDTASYLLDDEDLASTDDIALNADKKSVTITWNTALSNQTEYDLTVDGVADAAGAEMKEEVTVTFLANDVTLPVAESLTLVGPNKFQITFSEPINNDEDLADDWSVVVEDKEFDYDVNEIVVEGNEATIELSDDELEEGEYSVEVTGFRDYAELKGLKKTFTMDYAKDTAAPVATVKSATQTKVVVEFNKPVYNGDPEQEQDLTADFFYHTYSKYNPVYVSASADNDTYTLYFTEKAANAAVTGLNLDVTEEDGTPLPEGNVKFVVVCDGDDNITDAWGNEVESNQTFTVAIAADTTAPTVTKITVVDQSTIKVYFSEPVDAEDEDYFTVVDEDGEDVYVDDVVYDEEDDYATITFTDDLEGEYSITIADIVDLSLEENEIEKVTKKFNMSDKGVPVVASADVVGVNGTDYDYIYVTFPEDMSTSGANSVLNKDNYRIISNNGTLDLTSDDKIATFGGANRVKISLADNEDGYRVASNDVAALVGSAEVQVEIGRVADALGNKADTLSETLDVVGEAPITIAGVKTLSAKTIEITVNGQLKSVSKSDFTVDNGDETADAASLYAISTWKIDDGQTIITAVLPSAHHLDTSASKNLTVAFSSGDLVTLFGSESGADSFGPAGVVDKYAPSVVTGGVTVATDYIFHIKFGETLAATNETLYAHDLVVKNSKGDVLVPNVDYTTQVHAVSGDILEVTIDSTSDDATAGDYKVYSNDTIKYIEDVAGNNAKAFTSSKSLEDLVPRP